MADVASTAIIDHGTHNIDIPIKGHFQKVGQPRGAKLGMRSTVFKRKAHRQGFTRWWNTWDHKPLGKMSCNNRRESVRRVDSGTRQRKDRDVGLGGEPPKNGLGAWKETEGWSWGERSEGYWRLVGQGVGRVEARQGVKEPLVRNLPGETG